MQIHSASNAWDLWIERSKTQPLKITVIQPPDLSREEKDAVRSLMDKTMANFYRWHDIRMEIHDGDYPALVLDFPATLKRLSLMNVDLFPTSLVPATTLWKLQRSEGAKVIGKVTLPCLPASRFKDRYQLLGLKDSAVTIDSLRSLELNRESSSELERALRRIILPWTSLLASYPPPSAICRARPCSAPLPHCPVLAVPSLPLVAPSSPFLPCHPAMPPRKKQAAGPVRRSNRQANAAAQRPRRNEARNDAPSPPPQPAVPAHHPQMQPAHPPADPVLRIQARLNDLQGEPRRLLEEGLRDFEANFVRLLAEVERQDGPEPPALPAEPPQGMHHLDA